MYDVLAHTPLFIWHPHSPLMGGRVNALTSAVDLYATMLDALGLEVPGSTHSRSLMPLLLGSVREHREWAIYGYWGSTVNVTDGRYTYLHPCREDVEATCYSTMMIEPIDWFAPPRPKLHATAGRFLPYTDSPVWRYTARSTSRHGSPLLFDIESDPEQQENLAGQGASEEAAMRTLLINALQELSAPPEQYERLGILLP
ncbi:sulfatase/phosphatase domain-containing protein [Thermobaculum terrenum]|uniref:sulfatase/phosphatase domain-containing protein n=1 Tax=Thermobaculum terrenum TaxID=166501 RepID=UPI00019C0998|nr:sulfatase/phosphatase domain-containing protein [Thermobaculum terrenum]